MAHQGFGRGGWGGPPPMQQGGGGYGGYGGPPPRGFMPGQPQHFGGGPPMQYGAQGFNGMPYGAPPPMMGRGMNMMGRGGPVMGMRVPEGGQISMGGGGPVPMQEAPKTEEQVAAERAKAREKALTLYVGNITREVPDALLQDILGVLGTVARWRRPKGINKKLEDYGMATFEKEDEVLRAHRLLSDLEFNGKTLACTINDKSQAFLDDYLDRALTDLALEAEDKAAAAAGEAVPDAKDPNRQPAEAVRDEVEQAFLAREGKVDAAARRKILRLIQRENNASLYGSFASEPDLATEMMAESESNQDRRHRARDRERRADERRARRRRREEDDEREFRHRLTTWEDHEDDRARHRRDFIERIERISSEGDTLRSELSAGRVPVSLLQPDIDVFSAEWRYERFDARRDETAADEADRVDAAADVARSGTDDDGRSLAAMLEDGLRLINAAAAAGYTGVDVSGNVTASGASVQASTTDNGAASAEGATSSTDNPTAAMLAKLSGTTTSSAGRASNSDATAATAPAAPDAASVAPPPSLLPHAGVKRRDSDRVEISLGGPPTKKLKGGPVDVFQTDGDGDGDGANGGGRVLKKIVYSEAEKEEIVQAQRRRVTDRMGGQAKVDAMSHAEQRTALVATFPHEASAVFSMPIDWELVDHFNVLPLVVPWIRKAVTEVLAGEDELFCKSIFTQLHNHARPHQVIAEVEPVLADEATDFVLRLWREFLILYETSLLGILPEA